MVDKYIHFLRGVSVNWIGRLGVILTTSAFITFLVLELARLIGIFTNQYMGLITYLAFPTLFIIGLVLIPLGWLKYCRQNGKTTRELLSQRFNSAEIEARQSGSTIFLVITGLSVLNVIFMGLVSMRGMQFMDGPVFCGTACHRVMNPEWVVYQDSPHARVACVDCHVGEGVDALIASKLNGMRQMFLASLNLYNRPIPTPVHTLRPARETCEKCHWPDKFYGNRLKTIVHFEDSERSQPRYTTLGLKIDTGGQDEKTGIHWHVAVENEVRYASVDDDREQMVWVDARQSDGSFKRYHNLKLAAQTVTTEATRTMDCVDCHNRATHIYQDPAIVVDEKMKAGLIDPELPFIKGQAVSALTREFPSYPASDEGIRNHIEGFYQRKYPDVTRKKLAEVDQAVTALQSIYRRNIHPYMNITWGTYPSFIGHQSNEDGCFRCHNQNLVSDDGAVIDHDCTMCHSILSQDSAEPFQYLLPATDSRDSLMHESLQQEFMNWF